MLKPGFILQHASKQTLLHEYVTVDRYVDDGLAEGHN